MKALRRVTACSDSRQSDVALTSPSSRDCAYLLEILGKQGRRHVACHWTEGLRRSSSGLIYLELVPSVARVSRNKTRQQRRHCHPLPSLGGSMYRYLVSEVHTGPSRAEQRKTGPLVWIFRALRGRRATSNTNEIESGQNSRRSTCRGHNNNNNNTHTLFLGSSTHCHWPQHSWRPVGWLPRPCGQGGALRFRGLHRAPASQPSLS